MLLHYIIVFKDHKNEKCSKVLDIIYLHLLKANNLTGHTLKMILYYYILTGELAQYNELIILDPYNPDDS